MASFAGTTAIGPIDMKAAMAYGPVSSLFTACEVIIGVGFAISIIYEVYKHITGAGGNYWLVLGKFVLLLLFFQYGPWLLTEMTGDFINETNKINADQLSKQFDILDDSVNKNLLGGTTSNVQTNTGTTDQAASAGNQSDASEGNSSSFFDMDTFLYKGFVKIFLWVIKGTMMLCTLIVYFMLKIVWPIVFQFAYIGLVFAVTLASIPGGGGAIKEWILLCVEILAWPFIYNVLMEIITKDLANNISELNKVFVASKEYSLFAMLLANSAVVVLILGYMIAIAVFVILVPKISNMVVRSRGAAAIGSSVTGAFALAAGKAGSAAVGSAASAGGAAATAAGSAGASAIGSLAGSAGTAAGEAYSAAGKQIAPSLNNFGNTPTLDMGPSGGSFAEGSSYYPPGTTGSGSGGSGSGSGGGGESGAGGSSSGSNDTGGSSTSGAAASSEIGGAASPGAASGGGGGGGGRQIPFANRPGVPADVEKGLAAVRKAGHADYGKMNNAVTNLSDIAQSKGKDSPEYQSKLGEIRSWQSNINKGGGDGE